MKVRKFFKNKLLIGLGVIVFLSHLTSGCFSFRMSKGELKDYFSDKSKKGSLHQYTEENWKINYVSVGEEDQSHVIFVHGAPGSYSAFINYLGDSMLTSKARLISVDRPGYGHSNFGISKPSLQGQAKLLKPILELNKTNQPTILVGHSLGGPVVARMAMDFPELVDALVLVAPSISPDLEPDEWFRLPLYSPFLRWLLPKSLRVTNDEIYFLKEELKKMLPLWEKIRVPVIVIQGGQDKLVHPGNAKFAQERLVSAPVKIIFKKEMNHFVPWNNYNLIKDAVLTHLSKTPI